MRAPLRGCALGLVWLLLGCASGAPSNTSSMTAPGTDIAAYATFGLQAPSEAAGAAEAPLSVLDANIREAIRSQLTEKGYREVEVEPDFWIGFESTSHLVEKASKPSPVRIGVGVGSYGGPIGGGVGTSVPVGKGAAGTVRESRFSIRAIDPKSNRELWVGTATGESMEDAGAVEKTVAGTLAEFPTRRR